MQLAPSRMLPTNVDSVSASNRDMAIRAAPCGNLESATDIGLGQKIKWKAFVEEGRNSNLREARSSFREKGPGLQEKRSPQTKQTAHQSQRASFGAQQWEALRLPLFLWLSPSSWPWDPLTAETHFLFPHPSQSWRGTKQQVALAPAESCPPVIQAISHRQTSPFRMFLALPLSSSRSPRCPKHEAKLFSMFYGVSQSLSSIHLCLSACFP